MQLSQTGKILLTSHEQNLVKGKLEDLGQNLAHLQKEIGTKLQELHDLEMREAELQKILEALQFVVVIRN